MARPPRRCHHCRAPLKATVRSDAKFCSKACAQAERRRRRHFAEAVELGFVLINEGGDAVSVRCPVCGRRFIPGHGHRRDAIYDRAACRQAAYRARKAQRLRETVTHQSAVEPARSRSTALASTNELRLVGAATKDVRNGSAPPLPRTRVA